MTEAATMARGAGRQVTILGLGLFGGGAGAARYFAERGWRVIVTDSRKPETLSESIAELKDLPIEYHLGGHDGRCFAGSEMVIVNPGVPENSEGFRLAKESGARMETEINLLFRLCPAPIAAVTGSNGKSTTVALLGEMLKASGRSTWVGGNLGGSLLPHVDEMRTDDAVVLEISSFQAERFVWGGISPHVGMVLNITPNHFDRHKDMAEYAAAKRQMLSAQKPGDFAILNAADPILREWKDAGHGRKMFIGAEPSEDCDITFDKAGATVWREAARLEFSFAGMRVPGMHNRFNAACAGAGAWLMGADRKAIESGLKTFAGLPHRIEFAGEHGGVKWYNDSIATTPESTVAALDAFEEPMIVIAGGSSKNLSYADVGRRIAQRAKCVVLLGVTSAEIERAICDSGFPPPPIHHASGLEEAVAKAASAAKPGDVVILSPASASFDMFRNFAERGEMFKQIVAQRA